MLTEAPLTPRYQRPVNPSHSYLIIINIGIQRNYKYENKLIYFLKILSALFQQIILFFKYFFLNLLSLILVTKLYYK